MFKFCEDFIEILQAKNEQKLAEDMRKDWEADKQKIQKVQCNILFN